MAYPASSYADTVTTSAGLCALTYEILNVGDIISSVGDDGAGGTAVFIGTTRNSFGGNTVTKLEYQAYTKLALKTMAGIVMKAKEASQVRKCSIYHRLGEVPVGQPSIVIAVACEHRKEAFDACATILEDIKRDAQIWKREFYEGIDDKDAEWKANA